MTAGEGFLWVAADPKQPGAAFAACIDDKSPEMYRDLADWAKRGGVPKRVRRETAMTMLNKWKRPSKSRRVNNSESRGA